MELVIIGVGAGLLSGLFGIGGGLLIVPALMLVVRMTPQKAIGTSLAALLLPVGALGVWEYYRSGQVDVRVALLLALGLFVGAWLGAQLALKLPARDLQRLFAVFLVVVAGRLWWTAK